MKPYRILLTFGAAVALLYSASVLSVTSPIAAQQAAPPVQIPALPDGPGKTLILQYCTNCHGIANITSARKDEDGWTATLTKMVGYGMQGNEDDLDTILAYLTKNFGPQSAPPAAPKVEINKESAADLVAHLAISRKDADAIVAYREKNGPFKSFDDLRRVPDVDAKKIEDKKDVLSFAL